MQEHTITLCMIVKNEEKYLERCLKSVKGIVDDIIIVDTGSTDHTVEIAKKNNAVVKHFKWIDDFAAARNYSISEVKTEYILVLDADEYLDDNVDLQKELTSNKDFYKLVIKNYQGTGLIVFHQNIRLFKAGIGLKYSGKLHERLNTYDKDTSYIGSDSDIIIHHLGYLPEIVSEKSKRKRNYDIMALELKDNPTGYSYYNMGLAYMNGEEYDKALDMFKKSFILSKDKEYVKGMLVRMAECLHLLDRVEEGIKLLLDAIKFFPRYTDLHYTLGKLYFDSGYLKDAEAEFKECLKLGERFENISTEGVGSYMADYRLALIYEKEGRSGDAFEKAYMALTKRKSFTPALTLYIKLMQRAGIATDQIKNQLNYVYKLQSVEDLKSLVYSLYDIRSPLLGAYEHVFGEGQSAEIKAIAAMLNKQYDKALKEWEKVEIIHNSYIIDATVMCLLCKDQTLLKKLKRNQNFGKSDWKVISGILLNENNENIHLSYDAEKYLLRVCEYLVNTEEFGQFEYISGILLKCSVSIQEELAAMLIDYGYSDTAIDLLLLITERYSDRYECNILLGDAYMRQENYSEALGCFKRGLNIKQNYSTYEKIYNIYEKSGEKGKLNELSDIIKERFPLSLWLKTEGKNEQ